MIKVNCQQGSENWYQARLGRITGSRFATAMMGESTTGYKGLIATIAGEIISGEMEETYTNEIMERGKELESDARELYESIFETEVEEVGFLMFDEDDQLHEWTGYSPDGLIDNEGLLEIKCPLFKTHLEYIERNELPNDYKWQVQGGLWLSGLKWCDFMSYYPNTKPFIIRVYPDFEMQLKLKERVENTIELIKNKIQIYERYDYLRD